MQLQNIFIHHVFFWLHNAESETDKQQLVEGLRKLSSSQYIKDWHIGVPANTNREVIERSYSVSWCLIFANAADQEGYQTDPIHLQFIDECKHLWKKVVVHDSVDA
ncbi:MAG TPA: Dabb family protein [Chitinophagaceae bacterium]|nr:Dabb family protein [Chitinophagaceae bacterium]